jgi:hypothetical protein
MSEGDSEVFGKMMSAGVTESLLERLDEETREDESQSATIRRLVKEGLEQSGGESLRKRIVSIAVFLGVAGLPVVLAANGSVGEAFAFLVVIAALDFVQSLRGGQTFIRI